MAYATIEDVSRLMAQFPLNGSKPNTAQVESIIADIEHEVNTVLNARGIFVPVTSPTEFVGWLGLLTSYGATAAVLKSMFPSATGPAETPAYAFWEARYRRGLDGLRDGSLIPGDTPKAGHAIKPSTYFTRNPDREEELGLIAEPFFKRNQRL